MSAQHTPGPVTVKRGQFGSSVFVIYGKDGFPIAQTISNSSPEGMERARRGEHEANASRLVACWNACEGVPTEVLEAQQAGGLPWRVADQIDARAEREVLQTRNDVQALGVVELQRKLADATAQRDELLAATQGLLAIVSDSRGVAGYHQNGDTAEWDEFEEVDVARAAIAKATGEQA